MKKLFTFLAGAALLGSLSACSSDEPTKGPDSPENPIADAAYLSVRILSADNASRTITDGGYQDSDNNVWLDGFQNEHKVKNAKFFFFDENGIFVTEGNTVDPTSGDEIVFDKDATEKDHVEFINNKNVIALKELAKSQKYPSYMLTVLNAPDFKVGANLSETVSLLSKYYDELTVKNSESDESTKSNFFVMSTSSYSAHTEEADEATASYIHKNTVNGQPAYFATFIPQGKYTTDMTQAGKDNNVVDVYVERLAAKAEVGIELQTGQETKTITEGGSTYTIYRLSGSTLAGGSNDNTSDPTVLETPLYLRVLGWNLNATVSDSYMFKNIDVNWNFSWWNNVNHFRSFWGKSRVYDTKPDNLVYRWNTDLTIDEDTKKIVYDKLTSMCMIGSGTNRNYAYCNENTNTVGNIFENYTPPTEDNANPNNSLAAVNSHYVTHAVIFGEVCDENGKPIDMVRGENGLLFKTENYIQYIIDRIDNAKEALNLWTLVDGEYKQIGTDCFALIPWEKHENEQERTGATKIVLVKDNLPEKLYTKQTVEESGASVEKMVELTTDETRNEAIAAVEKQLEDNQPLTYSTSAIIYDGGLCVYYVPIEHLAATSDQDKAVEGYYGVVRNHWYQLKINKFEKVGHGIWNPGNHKETLDPGGPEDPLYYLGARINILSWKIVKQGVVL